MKIICILLLLMTTFAYSEEIEIDGVRLGGNIANVDNIDQFRKGSISTSLGKFYTYFSLKKKVFFGVTNDVIGSLGKEYENISNLDAISYISDLEEKWGDVQSETPLYQYIWGHKFWSGYIVPNNSEIGQIIVAYKPYRNSDYKLGTLMVQYVLKTHIEYLKDHDF